MRLKDNEKGSSFTESLITIVVAGVACVAFISVVAGIVRETKNREVSDMMANYAFDGLGKMRLLSNYGLPNELEVSNLYTYVIEDDELVLKSSAGTFDCTGEFSECELLDLDEEGDNFFYRKFEVSLDGDFENGVAKVTVEVGRVDPTGIESRDSYRLDGFIQLP